MVHTFGPIAIQIAFAIGFAVFILWFTNLIGPKKNNPVKDSIYECGVEAFNDARGLFHVKFYLVAVLFILFDIEAVFIIPWAVTFLSFKQAGQGLFIFLEMLTFIAVLIAGYVYIIRKGALKWE